jgi:hypothetical protein
MPSPYQRPISLCPLVAGLAIGLVPVAASAALAPLYQNDKDLTVLVEFVRSHPLVLERLRSLDLEKRVVRYDRNCVARFGRPRPEVMMPGPAPALRFLGSNCPIDRDISAPATQP